jgi:biotin transporter BioY
VYQSIQTIIGEYMLANATIADLLRPTEKISAAIYDISLIICGSLLIALCARVKVLLPFSPIPVTAQTFAVLIIGALFGAKRGSFAALIYVIEGAIGLPIFALGGGFFELLGPTGGYLIGFIPAAYITGYLAQKGWDRRIGTTILAMVFGNIVIYSFGLVWMSYLMGINKSILSAGLYPFIASDLVKIILAAAVLPAGWKLLKSIGFDYKRR